MKWGLAFCVVLVAWALYWPVGWLGHSVWVPIAVTAAVLSACVFFLHRRARARDAAAALEEAIVQQGEQQALRAPADRRAEIHALQQQFREAVSALKRPASGGKRGEAALYSLPWYMIIGPPGAGKTTALKASGLRFPDAGTGASGVSGVGGTRNCDWWITDEAILLDTAGRYTTEPDDHGEWLAFLEMLKRHRGRCPINGVIVAISVAEVAGASAEELESHGKKIRARIDEVTRHLQMIVPVYVLFTKADLVAGFVETFGDMKRSDRRQPWGATIELSANESSPRAFFEAHFDQLVLHLQARSMRRLVAEHRPEAQARIYHFPLELAGVRRNLAELVETIFTPNIYQGTPLFRGFYFTSGTQEGRPLDPVLRRMSQVMGLPPAGQPEPEAREAKSYFLHDVLREIVFKDAGIARLDALALRRRARARDTIMAAAAALFAFVCVMASISFVQNYKMLVTAGEQATDAQKIAWHEPPSGNLGRLEPMLEQLRELDEHREEGVPIGMGWTMYQGERVSELTARAYLAHLRQGLVLPCKQQLEERLRAARGEDYLAEHLALKAYLMLDDSAHGFENVDVEWATGTFTEMWIDLVKAIADEPEADMRRRMAPHVRYYFTLLKQRRAAPVPLDEALIARVRKVLLSVPVTRRYHDQYVRSVEEEKIDAAGGGDRRNLRYPAFALPDVLPSHPGLANLVTSAAFERDGRWWTVRGPYTELGHHAVLQNIAMGKGLLESEAWVVPLGPGETPERIAAALVELANDYERSYIDAWMGFLEDVAVRSPRTLQEAIRLYKALTSPPWPHLQILRGLEDHTQWPITRSEAVPALRRKAVKFAEARLKDKLAGKTGGLLLDVDIFRIGDRPSVIPALFARTVGFGVATERSVERWPGGRAVTPLGRYISRLDTLRDQMERLLDENARATPGLLAVQLADAARETEALVAAHLRPSPDAKYRDPAPLLIQQLRCPLQVGDVRLPAPRLVPVRIRCL